MSLAFLVIEKALAWKVGNGSLVTINSDAIIVCVESIFLKEDLVYCLKQKGFCTLD
jgi:hypothetical protein